MMAEVGDRSAMRGVLRLGVAETIVHTWLPSLIKSVNTTYPNLSLEIEVDISPNLNAQLMAQEDRACLRAQPRLRLGRAQPHPVRLPHWLSRESCARPWQRPRWACAISPIPDHHLPTQDAAL